jgi:hypothetical protein
VLASSAEDAVVPVAGPPGLEPVLSAWESGPSGALTRPELRSWLSASDREIPVITGVDITVRGRDGQVRVDIVNAPPQQAPSGLGRSGGGFGLAGMRERVAACGGSLTSGPTPAGGWQVSALLPAAPCAPAFPAL